MRIEVSVYINEEAYKKDDAYLKFLFNPEDEDDTKNALKDIKPLLGTNSHIVLKTIEGWEIEDGDI